MADAKALLAAWSTRSGGEAEAWARARPGPSVEAIATRISRVPQAFLDERVSLVALAGDILGAPLSAAAFEEDARVRPGAAVGLWLVASVRRVEPYPPALAGARTAVAVGALPRRLGPVATVRAGRRVVPRGPVDVGGVARG